MKNENERDNNIPIILKSVFIGLMCAILISFIALFLIGYLMISTEMSDIMLSCTAAGICAVAVFAGGFVTSRMTGRAGLIMGILNAVLFFAIMCIICLAVFDNFPTAECFVRLGVMLVFGMAGGALGVGKAKTPVRGKRR